MASHQAAVSTERRPPLPLRRGGDVNAVFAARAVAHGSAMVVFTRLHRDGGPARAAVVAGRRVGSAVARNRAKRRLRAALRRLPLPAGLDIVVVARPPARTLPFPALVEQLRRLVERASTGGAVAG